MLQTPAPNRPVNLNPVAAAAIAVLLAVVAWLWLQRSPDAAANAPAMQPADAAAAPGRRAPAAGSRPDVLPFEARMSPAQARADQQSKFSAFESRYRQDSSDAAWAAPTEKRLLDAAGEPALNDFGTPIAYDAACRARLCKISLRFATLGQAQDWEQFYVTGLGGALTRVATTSGLDPDGKASLVIYGTRAGAEPLLDYDAPGGNGTAAAAPARR